MATSYDPTLPTPRDRMRFSLGDTADPPLRDDVEYDALLVKYSETEATMRMAESLAAEYAQNPSSVSLPGGISISYSTLVSTWRGIADNLRKVLAALPASGATLDNVTLTRNFASRSEYRRPVDWYPDGNEGDAW